jgi:hypothetical protein
LVGFAGWVVVRVNRRDAQRLPTADQRSTISSFGSANLQIEAICWRLNSIDSIAKFLASLFSQPRILAKNWMILVEKIAMIHCMAIRSHLSL